MKISKKIIGKYQEGGAMPPDGGAPSQDPNAAPQAAPAGPDGAPAADPSQGGGGGEDPIMQLAQMAQQALQGQDCQMMAQVCEGFISLTQQASGGGQPGGGAPQEAPVYRKGGVLVKKTK